MKVEGQVGAVERGLKSEMESKLGQVEANMKSELNGMKSEMNAEVDGIPAELSEVKALLTRLVEARTP
jgi:hypothetical protein